MKNLQHSLIFSKQNTAVEAPQIFRKSRKLVLTDKGIVYFSAEEERHGEVFKAILPYKPEEVVAYPYKVCAVGKMLAVSYHLGGYPNAGAKIEDVLRSTFKHAAGLKSAVARYKFVQVSTHTEKLDRVLYFNGALVLPATLGISYFTDIDVDLTDSSRIYVAGISADKSARAVFVVLDTNSGKVEGFHEMWALIKRVFCIAVYRSEIKLLSIDSDDSTQLILPALKGYMGVYGGFTRMKSIQFNFRGFRAGEDQNGNIEVFFPNDAQQKNRRIISSHAGDSFLGFVDSNQNKNPSVILGSEDGNSWRLLSLM